MTRTLYDSTTPADIPATATMIGAYVDGHYRTVDEVRRRFPKARVVTITVLGTPGANVCDTEPGNIGVKAAAKWAADEVAAGRHPTLYCMASAWGDVKAAVAANGITGRVSYWLAQYDGQPQLPAGTIAKQYADPKTHGKGHFDLSVVAAYWPEVDPKPPPPKRPWYRRVLRRGSIGRDVVALKLRLRAHGYRGFTVMPRFGDGCERAVRAFQQAHHLTVDGVVGPRTAAALGR